MAPPNSTEATLSDEEFEKLPKATYFGCFPMYQRGRFWFLSALRKPILSFQTEFQAGDNDVVLASFPKTGTTWLKALCSYIMNPNDDVLANSNPHAYVQTMDALLLEQDNLTATSSTQLFHTHLPYELWPDSIKNSGCKIVYITRNPKDMFVSLWHFYNKVEYKGQKRQIFPLEKAFEEFCDGVVPFGPFFDHVLEFWEESSKRPQKVLFLRYEELKRDTKGQVQRLADFLGRPFESDEDVENVIWRSSLERLKRLEVNNGSRSTIPMIPDNLYFRRGVVGDWANYFTDEMKQRLDEITSSKFKGPGLHLDDA